MKLRKSLTSLVLVFFMIPLSNGLYAQTYLENEIRFAECWSASMYIGKTQYYGDLSHDDKWEKLRAEAKLSGGISLNKRFNSFFSLTTDFFFSRLRSKKGPNNQPWPVMYYLSGEYFELSVLPNFDLVRLLSVSNTQKKVSVNLYMGIGYAIWNTGYTSVVEPSIENDFNNKETHKVVNSGLSIPLGLSIGYQINKKIKVFIDGQMRTITNDKLDNWVDGWVFDQLFVGSIGLAWNFNFKDYRGPKIPKQTRKTRDYMKVVYGCNLQ